MDKYIVGEFQLFRLQKHSYQDSNLLGCLTDIQQNCSLKSFKETKLLWDNKEGPLVL